MNKLRYLTRILKEVRSRSLSANKRKCMHTHAAQSHKNAFIGRLLFVAIQHLIYNCRLSSPTQYDLKNRQKEIPEKSLSEGEIVS